MKIKNIVKILIIFVLIITIFNTSVYATESYSEEKFKDHTQFDSYGPDSDSKISEFIDNAINVILSVLRFAAVGWAIGMLIYLAMKYMLLSNPWKKFQIKVDLLTYIIGLVLLFGASGLLKLVAMFIGEITD